MPGRDRGGCEGIIFFPGESPDRRKWETEAAEPHVEQGPAGGHGELKILLLPQFSGIKEDIIGTEESRTLVSRPTPKFLPVCSRPGYVGRSYSIF